MLPLISHRSRPWALRVTRLLTRNSESGQTTPSASGVSNCHTPSMRLPVYRTPRRGLIATVQGQSFFRSGLLHFMGSKARGTVSRREIGRPRPVPHGAARGVGVSAHSFFMTAEPLNLLQAIEEHAGQGSEANQVIQNFRLSRQIS